MLIRSETLEAAGGLNPIKDRLIDDCAMGKLIKAQGPIWLGLTDKTRSIRAYDALNQIWAMVSRTAFYQLNHSLPALIATIAGMLIVYLVPPFMAFFVCCISF